MQIKDVQQLRDAPPFGVTAVEGLLTVESTLQQALRYVPFCDEHRTVWSSHFAGIILEAASQIDSIWKATARIHSPGTATDKLNIKDHFDRFGPLVKQQEVVFFGGEGALTFTPFEDWQLPTFVSPKWWTAYNELKHDRLTHQKQATLEHTVNAVAGLLLAIIYSGACDLALITARLVDSSGYNLWANPDAKQLRAITFDCRARIETALFAHPVGFFGDEDCNLPAHWDSSSPRFNVWWLLNYKRFRRPPKTP